MKKERLKLDITVDIKENDLSKLINKIIVAGKVKISELIELLNDDDVYIIMVDHVEKINNFDPFGNLHTDTIIKGFKVEK